MNAVFSLWHFERINYCYICIWNWWWWWLDSLEINIWLLVEYMESICVCRLVDTSQMTFFCVCVWWNWIFNHWKKAHFSLSLSIDYSHFKAKMRISLSFRHSIRWFNEIFCISNSFIYLCICGMKMHFFCSLLAVWMWLNITSNVEYSVWMMGKNMLNFFEMKKNDCFIKQVGYSCYE